jgi:hypothetical protein
MDTRQLLAMGLDAGAILRGRGFTVDQWQTVVLSQDREQLCARLHVLSNRSIRVFLWLFS